MSDEEIIPLESHLCDNCKPIQTMSCYVEHDDTKQEWACVGLIPEPGDLNDTHDNLNTIRLCIHAGPDEIIVHEWTAYEANSIILLLSMAVNLELQQGQPTVELINELMEKTGLTDRLKGDAKDA